MHRHSYRGPTGLRRGGDATPRWRGSENSGHVLSHPEALSLSPCSFLPPRSLRGATCPPLLLRFLRALTEFTLRGLSLSCVPTATEPQQPPAFTTTVNRASFLQVPAVQVSKRGHQRGKPGGSTRMSYVPDLTGTCSFLLLHSSLLPPELLESTPTT